MYVAVKNAPKALGRKLTVITDSTGGNTRVLPVKSQGFDVLVVAVESNIATGDWDKVARYAERVAINFCRQSKGVYEVPVGGFEVYRSEHFK